MEVFEKPSINGFGTGDTTEFVTVVSVGSLEEPINKAQPTDEDLSSGYVTVLTIGDDETSECNEKIEEVLVYRLPGERLGFGLKFEGGTKASEFVKRLFIQSCASDSPASRVRSSWGCLTEGDEVLEIDSIPVKSMTRIDCVRCLKDSNVVIKLLVKHIKASDAVHRLSSKSIEDLPLVIAAEKKRTPPPPPPVPPRKIPRKLCKENRTNIVVPPKGFGDGSQEPPVTPRHTQPEIANGTKNRHQLSSITGRLLQHRQSPEVVKRDRRLSDGSIGPPDAEVYVDLFSHESPYCLSESDDTGSSISTVVDRFGSFPTTTTSSFAGSLPSTPTSVQKQMDLSNVPNPFDDVDFDNDNYLFSKLVSLQENGGDNVDEPPIEKIEKFEVGVTLQPPANFQDAPLSYGNEDVRIVEAAIKTAINIKETPQENDLQIEVENNVVSDISKPLSFKKIDDIITVKPGKRRPPPPPPRSKHSSTIKEKNNNDYTAKNEYLENLPRLVDFVPKSINMEKYETLRRFLENEQRGSCDWITSNHQNELSENDNYDTSVIWSEGAEFYTFNWSPSSQLATIGEDEEEGLPDIATQRSQNVQPAPIVIVENADDKDEVTRKDLDEPDGLQEPSDADVAQSFSQKSEPAAALVLKSSTPPDVDVMEAPSINSRQPPDGHEFPDYQEAPIVLRSMSEVPAKIPPLRALHATRKDQQSSNSVRNMIAIFSNSQDGNVPDGEPNDTLNKKGLSKSVMNINTIQSSLNSYNCPPTPTPNNYSHSTNRNSLEIPPSTQVLPDKKPELAATIPPPRLHTRSQSLIDISDPKLKPETDRWNLLVEQRRRGLSKLKGLIIPEHSDPEECIASIDLPEIKSTTAPVLPISAPKSPPSYHTSNHIPNYSTLSFNLTNWNTDTTNTIPKYSPAFKRKPLQVYGSKNDTSKGESAAKPNEKPLAKLQTQAVPSHADDECRLPVTLSLNDAPKSLESITSPTRSDCSFEYISSSPELKCNVVKMNSEGHELTGKPIGKSEDESDNDSAVSSSQSSYISRNSPPTSPNHLQSHFHAQRPESESRNKYELTGSEQQSTDSLNRRLLKPKSVEAINRKNILASAKCRSGRDLKVGSPLIQRKFENNVESAEIKDTSITRITDNTPPITSIKDDPPTSISKLPETKIPEKIATPPVTPEINGFVPPATTPIAATRETITPRDLKRTVRREPIELVKILPKSLSRNNRTSSVTDLRKNFEKLTTSPTTKTSQSSTPSKALSRLSLNLSAIPNNATIPVPAKRNSLPSLIPPTIKPTINVDSKKVLDEALQNLDETITKEEVKVIVLCSEIPGGSIGITLAGGTDYETKHITVHKVRSGSAAFRDGRLQKGDRILSINGKTMKGLTHAESIAILKEPVTEVIIVACAGKEVTTPTLTPSSRHSSMFDLSTPTPSKEIIVPKSKQENIVVSLLKDSGGLGFSMEGGKDSPQGDVPLVIKKLFTGGTADKCGKLKAGDELMEINGIDVSSMPRIDVWAMMKKLPAAEVILRVRR